MKQRLSFAAALARVRSQFLTRILQRSIQAFERSITHARYSRNKSRLSLCCFFLFRGFGREFKLDFGHDLIPLLSLSAKNNQESLEYKTFTKNPDFSHSVRK